jgi:hypothetical protein
MFRIFRMNMNEKLTMWECYIYETCKSVQSLQGLHLASHRRSFNVKLFSYPLFDLSLWSLLTFVCILHAHLCAMCNGYPKNNQYFQQGVSTSVEYAIQWIQGK